MPPSSAQLTWFSQLYDSYSPALYSKIFRAVRNRQIAEDLLQNVFAKIWISRDQYDPAKGRIYTWMMQICRNETIDYLRFNESKKRKVTKFYSHTIQVTQQPCEWSRIDARQLLSQLTTNEKVILELIYMQGFTFRQTSTLLSIPEGTVKTKVRKLLFRLRSTRPSPSEV